MNKSTLRPVIVTHKGEKLKGYFHKFVYTSSNNQSSTLVLVELDDGRLRYFEPYFVQSTVEKNKRQRY